MNFDPDPAAAAFRAEAREFIARSLAQLFPDRPADPSAFWASDRVNMRKWTQALNAKGWAVPHWPLAWGGTAWPPTWRSIFHEETITASCPLMDMIGTVFVGPVLYTFGTDQQKQRFLPRIRNGDEAWCQGFSESEAGSDVTALRTTALRDASDFVVNGRKIWITSAHVADMMFALVRVEAPGNRRQQGLSFLLIDMRTPGVSVRPIVTIDGVHRLNEVVLDNVRVSAEHLVGEQGKGWIYARYLLDKERSLVAHLPLLRRLLVALRVTLTRERHAGVPLIDDPAQRSKLAQFEVELGALEFLELRLLHSRDDDQSVQVLASMLKLRGTELRQRVSEALWEAFGARGLEFSLATWSDGDAFPGDTLGTHSSTVNYLYQRSATILGGTSEIQRNIIAGVSLGL